MAKMKQIVECVPNFSEGRDMAIIKQITDEIEKVEGVKLLDVDPGEKVIVHEETITPPPHEPGLLPRWLGDRGVNLIIAGGMGSRAQGLFAERNIRVVTGAPADAPEALVRAYLDGSLQTGDNACDH